MNDGLIPARYAKALYLVGREKKCDSGLYRLMKTVEASFADQPALQAVLANPFVSDADKEQLLSTSANATTDDSVFSDFLKLLAKNRRLDMARAIANAYIALYRRENKIYEVKVVSAAQLRPNEEQRLKDMISSHLEGGSMEYTATVNPKLIGGFTVSVGNERIDASISNELKQLRLNLIRK